MAEVAKVDDWERLRAGLRGIASRVELFPIEAGGPGDTEGVGISVPRMHANQDGWLELERVIRLLLSFGMTITELNSGSRVTEGNLERVREHLVGA